MRCLQSNPTASELPPDQGADKDRLHLYREDTCDLFHCAAIPIERRRPYAIAIYTASRGSPGARPA